MNTTHSPIARQVLCKFNIKLAGVIFKQIFSCYYRPDPL